MFFDDPVTVSNETAEQVKERRDQLIKWYQAQEEDLHVIDSGWVR